MSETIYQSILPNGRAVRFKRLLTEDFLSIQQRVSMKMGDRKDPGGGLGKGLTMMEFVAMCTKAITKPLPILRKDAPVPEADEEDPLAILGVSSQTHARVVDVDAMLSPENIEANGGWTELTYADLMSTKGEKGIKALFREFSDFNRLVALISPETPQEDSLLGKVQVVTGG